MTTLKDIEKLVQKRETAAREEGRQEGRTEALSEVRSLVNGADSGRATATSAKPASRKKPGKKRKNPWDAYTPEQREARIKKMLAGRGITRKKPAKSRR